MLWMFLGPPTEVPNMKTLIHLAAPVCILFAGAMHVATGQGPAGSISEARYEGTWVTTKNKKLDGTLTCDIKALAKDRWQGRFWGVWQRVPFDYTVEFSSLKDAARLVHATAAKQVKGVATIDGAHYDWVGSLSPTDFNIQFTGSRYEGYLALKRVAEDRPR
jgi:hypothetical protein